MCKKLYFICLSILFTIAISPFLYLNSIKTGDITYMNISKYNQELEVRGIIEGVQITPIRLSYPVYIKEVIVKEDSFVNKGQLMFTVDIEKMQELARNIDFTQYAAMGISVDKDSLSAMPAEIYATESGFVKQIAVSDEGLILAEENLCVIENNNSMLIKISIEQEDYPKVKVGDMVEFSPDIATSRDYIAVITDRTAVIRKESSLTGSKTVVDLFAEIQNPDDYIMSGLDISGKISNDVKYIRTLPYEFIKQDDIGEFVYVLKDGEKLKKYVDVGAETENEAEILTKFDDNTVFVNFDVTKHGKKFLNYENN